MDHKLTEYLQKNKEKYLTKFKTGTPAPVAADERNKIFDVLNLFTKKIYRHTREKATDFLLGLVLPWFVSFCLYVIDKKMLADQFWAVISIYVAALIVTFRPRRFVFFGLYANLSIIGATVVAVITYLIVAKPFIF